MLASLAQTCSGCAPLGATSYLEFQMPGIRRPDEALAQSPQTPGPADRRNANDGASGSQSPKKMRRPKKAMPQHPPELRSPACRRRGHRASPQMRGRTQDSSRESQAVPTPPWRPQAPRPAPAGAHPAPNFAESTAEVAAALHTARTATHKTTFRIDSSIARKTSRDPNSTASPPA